MTVLIWMFVILYLIAGLLRLPREWEIYVAEDHPSTAPDPDSVGAAILIGRFLRWPFRLHAQPRKQR